MKKILLFLNIMLIGLFATAHVPANKNFLPTPKSAVVLPGGSAVEATTVAGGTTGPMAYQLFPSDIFVDATGNLYVADALDHKVKKFAPGSSTPITVAGGNGFGSEADKLSPGAIAVDLAGTIYAVDANERRVQKWPAGATSGTTILTGEYFNGLFIDASGNLYASRQYSVVKYAPGDTEGVVVAGGSFGGTGASQLGVARGIFVDDAGNVYVVDQANNRVQKWAPGANSGVTVAGGNGIGSAANQLYSPSDVFVDKSGNIYVTEENGHRVQKWAPGATAGVTVAGGNGNGPDANQLSFPRGLFVDPLGNVFVADISNYRVQKFANPDALSNGNSVAGGNGKGAAMNQLNEPNNVFIDKSGNLFVADLNNNRIQKFALGSPVAVTVAGGNGQGDGANQLSHPTDVRVDDAGNIYVADFLNNRVQKWIPGAIAGVTVAGGNGQGSARNQLYMPAGIFVDKAGNIFVADYYNHRIQKWAPGATTGDIVAGGYGPGPAANQISYPNDVFVDDIGNIFIADQQNHRIQKWPPGKPEGVTVAGTGFQGTGSEQLSFPTGVYLDAAGNMFIADFGNQRVQKWIPGASSGVTVAGGNGVGAADNQLNGPVNVAIDANNNLFVSDAYNDRIKKFSTTGLSYRYIEGSFSSLPDFNLFVPKKTGLSPNVDLNVRPRDINDHYSIVWEGTINIPAPGKYTFETISDDGSKLYFNSLYLANTPATVNNDGLHASQSAFATVNVPAAGAYPIAIAFFEGTGDETIQVYWTGPGIPRQRIPDVAFASGNVTDNIAPDVPTNFKLTNSGGNFITLSWYKSFDNIGVTAYDIYLNGEKKYSTIETQITIDSLTPNSTYTFAVKARDFAGNTSGFSNEASGTTSAVVNGLNYKYYEGSWNTLPDFNTLTPVKTGTSLNVDLSVRPANRNDNFAFVWEGYITIPAAGAYLFETVSDDGSKLYFNSKYVATATATVNNDGVHGPASAKGLVNVTAPGAYPISITFFEKDGGEQMQVYWTFDGSRLLIPNAAFTLAPPPVTSGLNYRYYNTPDAFPFAFNDLTPAKTGNSPNVDISVRPAGVNDNFSFVWEGYINIPTPGNYTFETISDDGSRFYFNAFFSRLASPTIYNDGLHPPISRSATINIPVAGRYPVAFTYFEKESGEVMQVYWSGPGFARQLIPDAAFASSNSLAVLKSDNTITGSVTEEPAQNLIKINRVYPDPFKDKFTVELYNSAFTNDIAIHISDLQGRRVFTRHAGRLPEGKQKIDMSLGNAHLADGMYLVTMYVNGVATKPVTLLKQSK